MSDIKRMLNDARAEMEKALANTKHEFSSIRSGKATPNMLDTVRVEVYGQTMNLNQVANIAAPEPRLLLVTPYDKPTRLACGPREWPFHLRPTSDRLFWFKLEQ